MTSALDAWIAGMERACLAEEPGNTFRAGALPPIFSALRRAVRVARFDPVEQAALQRVIHALEDEDMPAQRWAVDEPPALRRWRRSVYQRVQIGSTWAVGILDALTEFHDSMPARTPAVTVVAATETVLALRRRVIVADWLARARAIAAGDPAENLELAAAWAPGQPGDVKAWTLRVLERARHGHPVAAALAESMEARDAAWAAAAAGLSPGVTVFEIPGFSPAGAAAPEDLDPAPGRGAPVGAWIAAVAGALAALVALGALLSR